VDGERNVEVLLKVTCPRARVGLINRIGNIYFWLGLLNFLCLMRTDDRADPKADGFSNACRSDDNFAGSDTITLPEPAC
jgi:hypothetical protein